MKYYSIAIDGPAGAGKSTIAKAAAAKLGFVYVDTGAMYRAMALYFMRSGIAPDDAAAIEASLDNVSIRIEYKDGAQQVIMNGENVNGLIRTGEVSDMASKTSVYPFVRKKMVQLQQELAKTENVIMDGRDIATYVLPNADLKLFVSASVEVRAKRRFDELVAKGTECSLEEIEKEIAERDYRDTHREYAPLTQVPEAVLVDTSNMTIDEVTAKILELFANVAGDR